MSQLPLKIKTPEAQTIIPLARCRSLYDGVQSPDRRAIPIMMDGDANMTLTFGERPRNLMIRTADQRH